MTPVIVEQGSSPLILGQPHGGTYMPGAISARLNARGLGLDDCDWHINRLYAGLVPDLTTVQATFHRYLIDANRDPAGISLYPGQNTTTLCPLTDFNGHAIWQPGQEPSIDEIAQRNNTFHMPYHTALLSEIERVKTLHGFAILYDCHSIRSNIPFLFDGTLPVFSIGTFGDISCAPEISHAVINQCTHAIGYDHVINGRFKGGWTTRHYGDPNNDVHTIQMELAQRAYMDEKTPWTYRTVQANQLRIYLANILKSLKDISR